MVSSPPISNSVDAGSASGDRRGELSEHRPDDAQAFDEEIDRLEELQQVSVFEQHLAIHDSALRVIAVVQRLPVRVVHAQDVRRLERVVRADDAAVGDGAAAPLHEQVRRPTTELSRQVAATQSPRRRVDVAHEVEEVPVLLQLGALDLLARPGPEPPPAGAPPLLAKELASPHRDPPPASTGCTCSSS